MIANAGATKHRPALEPTMEQIEKLYQLNVKGPGICATAAARKFIKLKTKGFIAFTASMTSYRVRPLTPCDTMGIGKEKRSRKDNISAL
ncbi:hypothetical protein F5Y19DRAFT_480995 [Xylariaceae sp. FL1651]|nr:hypothetical protein F5Y19DRAFT_480995 [Xylariaceae sp. FL1651]